MTSTTTPLEQRERSAQLVWMGMIIAFFAIQAIIWMVAIALTSNDMSHAVVVGYDEKALRWDEEIAQRRASEKLGWRSEFMVDATSDIHGFHAIDLTIVDSHNQPVEGAVIELTAFHRGQAGRRQSIELTEADAGVYTGRIQIQKRGRWQFDGAARKDRHTYLIDKQLAWESNR